MPPRCYIISRTYSTRDNHNTSVMSQNRVWWDSTGRTPFPGRTPDLYAHTWVSTSPGCSSVASSCHWTRPSATDQPGNQTGGTPPSATPYPAENSNPHLKKGTRKIMFIVMPCPLHSQQLVIDVCIVYNLNQPKPKVFFVFFFFGGGGGCYLRPAEQFSEVRFPADVRVWRPTTPWRHRLLHENLAPRNIIINK